MAVAQVPMPGDNGINKLIIVKPPCKIIMAIYTNCLLFVTQSKQIFKQNTFSWPL